MSNQRIASFSRFAIMLQTSVRRGRPKGTGIDDSERLARLDELLRIHPDWRPTTAIRKMGYSDPSAIRRLRDKYKIFALGTGTALNDLVVSASASAATESKLAASSSLLTR
jgi:hypothetical protein